MLFALLTSLITQSMHAPYQYDSRRLPSVIVNVGSIVAAGSLSPYYPGFVAGDHGRGAIPVPRRADQPSYRSLETMVPPNAAGSVLGFWPFEFPNEMLSAAPRKFVSDKIHRRSSLVEKIHRSLNHKEPRMTMP